MIFGVSPLPQAAALRCCSVEVLKVPIGDLSNLLLHLPDNTLLETRVPGIIWILEKQGLLKPKGGKK